MKTHLNISPGARLIHMYHNGVAYSWYELPKYNYDDLFMTIQETPVTFTNGIPVCPYCGNISERLALGLNPFFHNNEECNGVYYCYECSKYYGVATRMNVSEYYECKQP